MSDEIKSYNNTEKSASAGIKLLVVEIIVIIAFIVGVFIALSYFDIFDRFNVFNPFDKERGTSVSSESQDIQDNSGLPMGLRAKYVQDVEVKYILRGTVDKIEEKEDRYMVAFDVALPQIPVSKGSWVSKHADDEVSQVRISDVQPGDIITLVPKYSVGVEDWVIYDAVPLDATRSADM